MSTPNGDAAELVTVSCPECGEQITGAKAGRSSATWKLGTHRYVKHKITSGKPGRNAPTSDELAGDGGASPVLGIVHSITDAMGNRKGAPNADDLARGLGRGLGLTTVAVASLMVESDPAMDGATPATRDALIDELSLTDRAARDIMAPIARSFAGTRLNARFGRQIVDNVDVIGSVSELALLGMAWRRYLAARSAGSARLRAAADPYGYSGPAPSQADAIAGALPEFRDELATPAPQSGVVIGPEEVARMRAQQQGGM